MKNINKNEPRIVNLIGMAPGAASHHSLVGENWGVNHAWIWQEKLDKLFMIDGLECMASDVDTLKLNRDEWVKYIRGFKGEMFSYNEEYMYADTAKTDLICKTQAIPHEFLRSQSGTHFNSSISWMLAYAAFQEELGFQKVHTVNLFGIELWISHDGQEYSDQASCANYWIAYLNGKGIQVNIPFYMVLAMKNSNNLYGFQRKEN
jgi:hypothetical protein